MKRFKENAGGEHGFTLIELMITVVILGVIASVAVPAYTQYMQSARRADARLALLQISNEMEKYYSNNLRYISNLASVGFDDEYDDGVFYSPDKFYTLNLVSVTDTYYRAEANAAQDDPETPASNDGPQFKDTVCRTFSLDSSGNEVANDSSDDKTTAKCW